MRVATWNINGMRARLDFISLWLEQRSPDIVGLQELKMVDAQFPTKHFEALGYHVLTHGQKAWNGVAILSREPAEAIQVGLPGQEELGARLLMAKIGDLNFTTVYCPNGKTLEHDDFPRKLAWFDALGALVADKLDPGEPAVLCGDFNIVPSGIDSWNETMLWGEIFHTTEERSRFKGLLDWGFVDVYRQLYPNEPGFSWWDYRGGAFHRKRGLRIDALLATKPLADQFEAVTVDRDWRKKHDGMTASDHAPVVGEITSFPTK